MFQRCDCQPERRVVTQGGHFSFQFGRVVIAFVNLVRVVEKQVFGDFAHLRIDKPGDLSLFLMRMEVEITGMKQRLGQIFSQLAGGLRIVNVVNQLAAPDTMIGKIFHNHHRQLGVEVVDFHRVLRSVLVVRHQGLRLETSAVEGQRPGFPYAANVGQGLLHDNAAHAVSIINLKDQVEVTVPHFLRGHQLRRVIDAAKLLCVCHGIAGGEGMVLRHCLDPQKF